jgi:hypothetical protein
MNAIKMNAIRMPGFTAVDSVHGIREHYQVAKNRGFNSVHAVIPQVRVGGRRGFGGFWMCLACIAGCTIFVGDPVECADACIAAGACEPVLTA